MDKTALPHAEQDEGNPAMLLELTAILLDVSRTHLSLVLNGRRQSAPLKARYGELMKRVVSHTLSREELAVCRNFLLIREVARILKVDPEYLRPVLARQKRDSALLNRFRGIAALMTNPSGLLSLIAPCAGQ